MPAGVSPDSPCVWPEPPSGGGAAGAGAVHTIHPTANDILNQQDQLALAYALSHILAHSNRVLNKC